MHYQILQSKFTIEDGAYQFEVKYGKKGYARHAIGPKF